MYKFNEIYVKSYKDAQQNEIAKVNWRTVVRNTDSKIQKAPARFGVGAEFVAGEVLSGGFVKAGGHFVGEAVAVIGVVAPAGGVMPFLAVSCDVLLEIVADIHFQLGTRLELFLPVVVGIHVDSNQNVPKWSLMYV